MNRPSLTKLDFGAVVPNFCGGVRGNDTPTLGSLLKFSKESERQGFKGLWVIDHLLVGWPIYNTTWLDPLATLAALTPATEHITLGTAILVTPIRSPPLVAKEFATLDVLSSGRTIFGAGAGWWDKEFETVNVPKSERGARLTEAVQAIRELWTKEHASFNGKYYKFDDVNLEPKPVQKPHPPIWLAGGSATGKEKQVLQVKPEPVMERIAKFADGWIARAYTDLESMNGDWKLLQSYLSKNGRSPSDLTFAHLSWVCTTDGKSDETIRSLLSRCLSSPYESAKKEALVASKKEVIRRFEELSKIGVQYILVWPTEGDYDLLEFIAKDVIPSFR